MKILMLLLSTPQKTIFLKQTALFKSSFIPVHIIAKYSCLAAYHNIIMVLRWYLYLVLNKRKIGEMIHRRIIVSFSKLFMIVKPKEKPCITKY